MCVCSCHLIITFCLLCYVQMLINIGTFGILGTSNDEGWRLFSFSLYMIGLLSYKLWSAWIIILYFINQTWGSKVAEWFWIPFMTSAWGYNTFGIPLLLIEQDSFYIVCILSSPLSIQHAYLLAVAILAQPRSTGNHNQLSWV